MDYNTFDITKVNTYSENDQKSSSKHSASQSGFSFVDTLSGYLPNIKQPNAREAIDMQRADMRVEMNHPGQISKRTVLLWQKQF